MEFFGAFLAETARILYEGSFYILIGFLVAGLVHHFLPTNAIVRHLGTESPRSVFMAALLGAPIPLCSCGVLPAAAALRDKGASRSALLSFLISTPETGVDSIALTWGLLGPVMAIVRPVVAVVTAVAAGLASLLIPLENLSAEASDGDSIKHLGHDHGENCDREQVSARDAGGWRGRVSDLLGYGFGTLLDEISFWMVLGILLTGLLAAALPDNFFSTVLGWESGLTPMIGMVVVGIPLYLCASASTPVAAALIAKGLSPGAALVFLLVGPATNAATITVIGKLAGKRRLVIYLGSIAVVSVAAGLLLDFAVADSVGFTALAKPFVTSYGPFEIVKLLSAATLTVLLAGSLRRAGFRDGLRDLSDQVSRLAAGVRSFDFRRLTSPIALSIVAVALLSVLLADVSFVVNPGQSGIVQALGRVESSGLSDGLHWRLPSPLGRETIVDTDSVRQVTVGFRRGQDGLRRVLEREAFYLTADENIVDLRSVVHYRVSNDVTYSLGIEAADELVRGLARRQLVEIVAGRSIDSIITGGRRETERAYSAGLESKVTARGLGLKILGAFILDAHAPAEVHDAFRDVASSLEDREKEIYLGKSYALRQRNSAEGEATAVIERGKGLAYGVRSLAAARAQAFVELVQVHDSASILTRLRLYLENLERTLPSTRLYILHPALRGTETDLWLRDYDAKTLPFLEQPVGGEPRKKDLE